ncbi:MAG: FtsQ-type POTRA domain-containing protein [Candidatus Poribacteria bacterium]|nr:FtsQ-type POTRA domain-containing protein [Candidatus Poribacteria bacterium]
MMLSATEIKYYNDTSSKIAVSPSRTFTYFIDMIRYIGKFRYCQLSFYLFIFVISQSTLPIQAYGDQSDDAKLRRFLGKQTESDQTFTSYLTSSQEFSYSDVLQIDLKLDIPGNIRILTIDDTEKNKDIISVTLEKHVSENQPSFTQAFLQDISISGKIKNGLLELNTDIPEDNSDSNLRLQRMPDVIKHLQLNYEIRTPPDISVQLSVKEGDVYLNRLRGKVMIINEMGNVHLDETSGNLDVVVKKGRIHGSILLVPGENQLQTDNGSIDLSILDELAASLELTAIGGNIGLLLPKDYPADIKFMNTDQDYMLNIPSETDNGIIVMNGGGPLMQLSSTGTISILPNPKLHNAPKEYINKSLQENLANNIVQPVYQTPFTPTIDGNLSETAWLNATALHTFQNPMGTETAENPTDVYLLWDPRYFYIGIRAHIQDKQIPRVSQTQHDSPIWEDESVELLLDMTPESSSYSHIIINPIGGLFDQWVTKEGFPNFRFAPNDIKREQADDSVVRFQGDSTWKSDAIVATKIYANYWSLEIAIPHKIKEKSTNETWLFNVHRKSQTKRVNGDELNPIIHREYSYWLPINDEKYPWWPHWKEGMGKLSLIKKQPSLTELYEISEKFIVEAIEIKGNKTIPTEDVLEQIPIRVGSTITNEQLSRLISELDNNDWFEEVKLETVLMNTLGEKHQSDDKSIGSFENAISDSVESTKNANLNKNTHYKVTVQISFTEAPVNYARLVSIIGNKSFPNKFIKDWYDILPGYITLENIKYKQLMINDFYVNRGFPFAEVSHHVVNDVLQYNINEGKIDEIRFTGNRKISRAELITALDIDTEGVYFHSLGQAKVNNMQKKLSQTKEAFKSVSDWHTQREGGKNILIVEIKEQSLIQPNWFPIVGYNRVHGVALGAGGTLSTRYINEEQIFGSISLGVSSKILNYHVGIENSFFKRFPLTLGAGLFKLTDYSSGNLRLRPAEISLSDSFYGTSVDNYYQRQGQHFWIANKFGQYSQIRLEYTLDNHDNLFKSTNWSYLQTSLVKLSNPRIDIGSLQLLYLSYTFDTRDHKSRLDNAENLASQMILRPNERTRRGWRGNIGVEMAGGYLGGDLTYNVYKFELVRYNPLVGIHNINFRIVGDFADEPLPRQRLLYLGGSKTIRGYSFNSFAGDRRILLNVEHRIADEISIDTDVNAYLGWALSTFIDIGQVWWYGDNPFTNFSVSDFKSSVGVGFSIFLSPLGSPFPITNVFDFSIPLTSDSKLRTPKLFWRLERMF